VLITAKSPSNRPEPTTVYWHPRVLWLGIGCERGTPTSLIQQAVEQALTQTGLTPQAVAGIASLDLKADESALLAVTQAQGWPLRCFPAAELKAIPVPNPSTIVEQEVGTPSVAEAAALRICQEFGGGNLMLPKQIVRSPDAPGAVTVAIAQAQQEYSDRPGKLLLIGSGPGSLEQLTPAARSALVAADVLIGYGLYLDLLKPLRRPGQIVETSPITQERQRAQRAIALAEQGLCVAVVSSGDCGIYGMAGLVFECLARKDWDGARPAVEVIPGISALQAAASRVGAPLMHDFCAISLSDLLTPWPVIERRLEAAAQADFVIALYNPRSASRTHPLEQALAILRQYRPAKTPVALVRSAYRAEEVCQITQLGPLQPEQVNMLTTVLIGNQSSFTHQGWFVTPRGYLGNP
jgi:cobalt-precorrin 5A hydrolase/precorrin-3B C17-methyltransferase